jgi:hypothetical protein
MLYNVNLKSGTKSYSTIKLLEIGNFVCDGISKCGLLGFQATDLHFCLYANYNHLMQMKNWDVARLAYCHSAYV